MPSLSPPHPVVPSRGLMLRLREETRSQHEEAESHPFQRALLQGRLPVESYADYLEQLFLVHRALDAGLAALAENDARAGGIIAAEQFATRFLREDLKHFGRDESRIIAGDGTVELLTSVADARTGNPVALIGFHYVMLGSTNGGRFIAKAVRRAYGLESPGVRYLDPWGEGQTRIWQGFKASMDAAEFTPGEADSMVEAAKAMFRGIARIADGLSARTDC